MALRRYTIALAAVVVAMIFGSLSAVTPASAQGWYRHHHPRHYGYVYGYRGPRHCWTEIRTVRVQTRWGIRWRERPVRICR